MTLFSPVGREPRRGYLRPLGAFTVGLTVGAFVTATALWMVGGLAGPLPAVGSRVLLLCTVMVLLLRDLGVIRFWLPENHRQVPQSVLRKPGLQPAFQFGVELGTGVRTYVPSAAPYTVALTIVLLASAWPVAITAAGGFALGRAAMPATRLLSSDAGAWDVLLTRRLAWLIPCSTGMTALLASTLAFTS